MQPHRSGDARRLSRYASDHRPFEHAAGGSKGPRASRRSDRTAAATRAPSDARPARRQVPRDPPCERLQRDQADQLRSDHASAVRFGLFGHDSPGDVHRRHREVEQVQRDLGMPVGRHAPSDGAHRGQQARVTDRFAPSRVVWPEARTRMAIALATSTSAVSSDRFHAMRNGRAPTMAAPIVGCARHGTEVRHEARIAQLVGEPLELAAAQQRQRPPRGVECSRLVEVHGQLEIVRQRRADAPGQSRAPLEAGGADGHEGTDVERAEARVRPRCRRMSMRAATSCPSAIAASPTSSGGPTNVNTVRWASTPLSTWSNLHARHRATAAARAAITSGSRPSETFGTHSTIGSSGTGALELVPDLAQQLDVFGRRRRLLRRRPVCVRIRLTALTSRKTANAMRKKLITTLMNSP